ncbi:MAG: antibiotic biosynthesis monooxygenase [Actinomycetota bacterium]|nr:antibiotic biosynthesis monooxygenase [Actinomycetota bacterium]
MTFEFDLEADRRPAAARLNAVRAFLQSRPGFLDAAVDQLDRDRFTLVSKWESEDAANSALSGEAAAEQLALRAGIVHDRPDAVGVSFG